QGRGRLPGRGRAAGHGSARLLAHPERRGAGRGAAAGRAGRGGLGRRDRRGGCSGRGGWAACAGRGGATRRGERGGGPGGRPPPTPTIAAMSHGTTQSLERTMIHVLELTRRASVTALAIAPALALLAACGGRAEPQRPAPAVAERVEDP